MSFGRVISRTRSWGHSGLISRTGSWALRRVRSRALSRFVGRVISRTRSWGHSGLISRTGSWALRRVRSRALGWSERGDLHGLKSLAKVKIHVTTWPPNVMSWSCNLPVEFCYLLGVQTARQWKHFLDWVSAI